MKHYNLIIIGAGSAGIGAALKAHQEGTVKILLIEKDRHIGGILNQCIHDGFGVHLFKKTLTGPEYAHYLDTMLKEKNIDIILNSTVTSISETKIVKVFESGKAITEYRADAIILTSGSYERSAGAINLPGERSAGIMTAGQAQYFLNMKGYHFARDVLIVGSGDIGLIMARRLSLLGIKVHGVSEIMPYSSGLKRNIVQCLEDFNIPLYLSHKVVDVRGKPRIQEVDIAEIDETGQVIDGSLQTFKVDTLLLAVGLIPYVSLAEKLGIPLTKSRGPRINECYQTKIPWFFVAGNALHIHDLADDAYFEGEEAGLAASLYLRNLISPPQVTKEVKPGSGVLYVLPNDINFPITSESVNFKFRPNANFINRRVIVKSRDTIIYKKFFPFLFPSELVILNVPRSLLPEGEEITVEVSHES